MKLEASGRLSLADTVGHWLPEYPAWKDITIKRLLNMTSGIPNYSETETISKTWINEPTRDLSAEDLINAVYPKHDNHTLVRKGYVSCDVAPPPHLPTSLALT